ncbi:MAG: preprotein translocase subunit SecY [Oscillospiraceae bacterium]|jgi:preprotein translocase subunit SecY|nr:preprotein translocase subunit SecY [Oscillospiraceae bacterium]
MFGVFKNMFKLPDLRKKMLYTILIILVFRIGSTIPVPFVRLDAINRIMLSHNDFFSYIDAFTGGAFSKVTVFSMSISPYITASIVIQLLTFGIPALERIAREGAEGQKKLNKATRYFTVVLGLVQSISFWFLLRGGNSVFRERVLAYIGGFSGFFAAVVIVSVFTAGSALVMWLGERINEKGIGNGISVVLFAGILARGPSAAGALWKMLFDNTAQAILAVLLVVAFVLITAFTVFMTNAERKIPIQYAQRVVGRKMYGGQNSHIPVKVNMAGVMPIIFASSFLAFFSLIKTWVDHDEKMWIGKMLGVLEFGKPLHSILYFLLIIGLNYFYISVQYNPIEIANNLRKNNGTIPGIRPGVQTSEFLSKVISKVTLIGAFFLAFIALLPTVIGVFTHVNISLGGTTILIVIGVALDTMKQIESMMMMKQYKGFLE